MSVAKTKEDLVDFDVNLASEVESHELSKENVLKHRTKILKETFNLYPFFGGKNASLVRCTCGVKK